MTVVCSWCGALLEGDPNAPPDKISHGICKKCLEKQREDLRGSKKNPDEEIRRLERATAAGDPEAEAALLLARVRRGELEWWHVRALSLLGHPPARTLVPPEQLDELVDRREGEQWIVYVLRVAGPDVWSFRDAWSVGHPYDVRVQGLRVAGIGIMSRLEELVYLPVSTRADLSPSLVLLDPEDPWIEIPVQQLDHWRSLVASGQRVGDSQGGVLHENLRRLIHDLRLNDFGGESVLANYCAAFRLLDGLMRPGGLHSSEEDFRVSTYTFGALLREAERTLSLAVELYEMGVLPEAEEAYRAVWRLHDETTETALRVLEDAAEAYLVRWLLSAPWAIRSNPDEDVRLLEREAKSSDSPRAWDRWLRALSRTAREPIELNYVDWLWSHEDREWEAWGYVLESQSLEEVMLGGKTEADPVGIFDRYPGDPGPLGGDGRIRFQIGSHEGETPFNIEDAARGNPDVDLRELERLAAGGDRDALVRLVRERARRRIRPGRPETELYHQDEKALREATGTERYDAVALADRTREVSEYFDFHHFSENPERDASLLANVLLWFEHLGDRYEHRFLSPQEVGGILDLMPYNQGRVGVSLYDLRMSPSPYSVLLVANLMLDGNGIEDETVGRYEALASYVNMGDEYVGTLLYDEQEGRFFLTTAGDWIGENVGWCQVCGESFHVDDAAAFTPEGRHLCEPCAEEAERMATEEERENPDVDLRELERRWHASGSTEDEAAWLRGRLRAGDLDPDRLQLAAALAHPAAQLAFQGGMHETGEGYDMPGIAAVRQSWVRGMLGQRNDEYAVRVALAITRSVAPLLDVAVGWDTGEGPEEILGLAETWLREMEELRRPPGLGSLSPSEREHADERIRSLANRILEAERRTRETLRGYENYEVGLALGTFGELTALVVEISDVLPFTMSPMGHADSAYRDAFGAWLEANRGPGEDWQRDSRRAHEWIMGHVRREVVPWLLA